MKKASQTQNGNRKIISKAETKRYATFPTYHLLDTRLSMAQKGFFTMLYNLPSKWKITQKGTAHYFRIDEKTFNRYIKALQEYGYIEMKKAKNNQTEYILHDRPLRPDFNIKYINSYTIPQLNYFLNNNEVEQRYKDLIKKALNGANETSEQFNKTLEEIEQETAEEIAETDELPF